MVSNFFETTPDFFKTKKANSNGCRSDYASGYIPTIRHLTRIVDYLLDYEERCSVTTIVKDCGIITQTVNKALLWLINHKIVEKSYIRSYKVYGICKEWKELKDEK